MIGTMERKLRGFLIYRNDQDYLVFDCAKLKIVSSFPRTINVWQSQLKIWLLATGRIA